MTSSTIRTVLFDLDGTLIDSAPALVAAANAVRREIHLPELPYLAMRDVCSHGVRGLLWSGLRLPTDARSFEQRKSSLLSYYETHINEGCGPFEGISSLLHHLEERSIDWGVVTNKHSHLARLLCEANDLCPGCLIGGDSTPHPKPSPDPIFSALQELGANPETTLYVGDDRRDIEAGRAASCRTVAAAWGYVGSKQAPFSWNADWIARHPLDILSIISST